jgi:calcium-dependent protein kinase
MWTRTGTLYYKAPEMFDGAGYTESVDMWALGVITYEILSGCLPFNSEYMYDTIELI